MIFNIILDINTSINTWFRESKLPKFIKVSIAKSKRRTLRKKIAKFCNPNKNKFTTGEIFEFLRYFYVKIEGKYMYIDSITFLESSNKPPICSASMSYDDNDIDAKYYFLFNNVTYNSMEITIKLENKKGITTICNLRCGCDGLLEITEEKCNTDIVNLIGGLNAMIAEMISDMSNKELERSERIYEL